MTPDDPAEQVRDVAPVEDSPDRDAALQRAMTRIALAPEVDTYSPTQFRALLEEEGVSNADIAALLAQGLEKLLRYRRLIEGTIVNAVSHVAPLTSAHLGRRLTVEVRAFLSERGPRSRYLRHVVADFVAHRRPDWATSESLPEFLVDFAAYEVATVAVRAAPDPTGTTHDHAVDLSMGLRFASACRIEKFRHRVHDLELDDDPDAVPPVPPRETTHVLVYRGMDAQAYDLELSPLAFEVISRLLSGMALGLAVQDACTSSGQPLTQAVLDGTAALLADLAEKGVLLGSADMA